MQLRVARLCLDCEELHVADVCPVCASESYAFLATWLPSEERRKWRRGRPPAEEATAHGIRAWSRAVFRWLDGDAAEERPALRRRVSDRVPRLDFDEHSNKPVTPQSLEPQTADPVRKPGS